ncbi:2-C-methyl-D-erythritol 2,4-cyclodiphosphate synthase [Lagierella sp.]|uniref:2-C-methyl-D-erythritol 2,4-cyclodiphosphate synthase n=1 Tax=Lagierella sp. TaxID=2849657 RepID=UPI0026138791|nr:2-C-methyl-D-erythritol 2,4-cyclodiphosphate synthase [Lagierella sp.]
MRIGFGYDVHKLVENRDLILGGKKIQYDFGLLGHSDADVLVHAIMDAILGALALGDIGKLFPDTDMAYKDIDSMILLDRVYKVMDENGFEIGNVDCTIACEMPKLAPHIEDMRLNIANGLRTSYENISIKATTTEKMGFEGRKEGISAYSVVLLEKK